MKLCKLCQNLDVPDYLYYGCSFTLGFKKQFNQNVLIQPGLLTILLFSIHLSDPVASWTNVNLDYTMVKKFSLCLCLRLFWEPLGIKTISSCISSTQHNVWHRILNYSLLKLIECLLIDINFISLTIVRVCKKWLNRFLPFVWSYVWKCVCCCCVVQSLNCVQLFGTPWIVFCHAPLSVGFSRQEYWSGLSCMI